MSAVICQDNLTVLAKLPDATLDLIYIDPPFGTGVRRRGAAGTYDDPGHLGGYLDFLRPRLAACHRVLAATGSLFVHLDWRAVHYVRVELDRLFGPTHFVNEIVWCYSVGGKSPRGFGRKHDTILWYARGPRYAFYPDRVRVPRKPNSHMKVEADERGRPVQVKRDRKTGRHYRYPVHAGKVPEDYWTDIETLNRGDAERTGWPSQKPEALLDRIVQATTRPGDWVADFFSGSGTTAVVAARLGRRYLAVDTSPEAVAVTLTRLRKAGFEVPDDGVPHL
jgi:DNA modification methylase